VTTTNSSLVWLVEKLRGFGFQGRMFWVAVIVVESGEVPDESDAEEEEEVVESESTFRGGSGEEGQRAARGGSRVEETVAIVHAEGEETRQLGGEGRRRKRGEGRR